MTEFAISHENNLLLEQPFLKVPFELTRKTFKTSQRYIERDRDAVLSSLKTAAQNAAQSPLSAAGDLDNVIQRLEALKRKLRVLQNEETQLHTSTRSRISHIQALHDISSHTSPGYDTWSKTRLDRLLVDYLLRNGYSASALALAQEVKIEDLVDIRAFSECLKIEASLRQGKLSEALNWCTENRAGLKKLESELEAELRMQQYIELLRTGHTAAVAKIGGMGQVEALREATAHARKYLAATLTTPTTTKDTPAPSQPTTTTNGHTPSPSSSTPTANAIHAAGLLAFPPQFTSSAPTHATPYSHLYSPTRYDSLATLFLATHHRLLSLPPTPTLHIALSAGLSALKTPSCHSAHAASTGTASTSTSGAAGVCPICSTELNELARGVPWSLRTNSTIEAEPVVFPNGRIYGLGRLRALNERAVAVAVGAEVSGSGSGSGGESRTEVGRSRTATRPGIRGARGPSLERDAEEGEEDDAMDVEEDEDDEDEDEYDARRRTMTRMELDPDDEDMLGLESEEEGVPGGRGRVRDPMTGEWFEWRDVRKVYIM